MPSKSEKPTSKSPKFIVATSSSKINIADGLAKGIWWSVSKNKNFLEIFSSAEGEPVLIFFTYYHNDNATKRWYAVAKIQNNITHKVKNSVWDQSLRKKYPNWGEKTYDVFWMDRLIEFKNESDEILYGTQSFSDGDIMSLDESKQHIQKIMSMSKNISNQTLNIFNYCLNWTTTEKISYPPKMILNYNGPIKEITKDLCSINPTYTYSDKKVKDPLPLKSIIDALSPRKKSSLAAFLTRKSPSLTYSFGHKNVK